MFISLNLPQFIKKRTLFIVTDREHARFYLASNGELAELVEFAIHPAEPGPRSKKTPQRRRQGALLRSPRGLERTYHMFAKQVSATALKLLRSRRFGQVYLFGPHHYQAELLQCLHSYVRAKVVRSYSGDFIHDHPLELVRRTKELPE